jgi:hypothetical protein
MEDISKVVANIFKPAKKYTKKEGWMARLLATAALSIEARHP